MWVKRPRTAKSRCRGDVRSIANCGARDPQVAKEVADGLLVRRLTLVPIDLRPGGVSRIHGGDLKLRPN